MNSTLTSDISNLSTSEISRACQLSSYMSMTRRVQVFNEQMIKDARRHRRRKRVLRVLTLGRAR